MEASTLSPAGSLFDGYKQSKLGASPVILDSYETEITRDEIQTVDDACRDFFTNSPDWLVQLMRLRNRLVGWLGFTAGSDAPPELRNRPNVGDEIGVFEVVERSDDEILLGIDDDRFSMRLSVLVNARSDARFLRLSTAAYAHDALGKLYLSLVKFPHKPIAAMMTRRIAEK